MITQSFSDVLIIGISYTMNSLEGTVISRLAFTGFGRLVTMNLYRRMSHFSGFLSNKLHVYSLQGSLKFKFKYMLFLSCVSTSAVIDRSCIITSINQPTIYSHPYVCYRRKTASFEWSTAAITAEEGRCHLSLIFHRIACCQMIDPALKSPAATVAAAPAVFVCLL